MNRCLRLLVPVLFVALPGCAASTSGEVDPSPEAGAVSAGEGGPTVDAGDGGVVLIGQEAGAVDAHAGGPADAAHDGHAEDAASDAVATDAPEAMDGALGADGGSVVDEGGVAEAGAGIDAAMEAGCAAGQLSCGGACVADDVHDCGACGHDCTGLAHVAGTTSCAAAGVCSFPASSCAPGWADCDGNPDDGCETDVSQAGHCGGCGNACPADQPVCAATGAAYSCTSGCPASAPSLCGSTCADTTSDPGNCGACGNTCPAAIAHAQPVCSGSACGTQCDTGYTACGGACVDVTGDAANCGGCGVACSAGQVCSAGHCECTATSCAQGCCDSAGQCVGWAAETVASCGTGGAACSACGANQVCGGQGSCACAPGLTACSGGCLDLSSDDANCGACGNACAAGQACAGGQCVCTPGSCPQGCCSASGACVPWAAETASSCGTAGASCGGCPSGDVCSAAGACECTQTMCGASCVDVQTDASNCGACGHSCLGGACSNGACQPVTLATTGGADLVVDANDVYWSNGTNVFSCPLGGGCGAGKVIFTGPTNPDFVTGAIAVPPAGTYGDRLFVATGNWAVSNLSGGLYSVPRAGGAATAINSGEYPFTSVAFDASAGLLYYAEEFGGSPQTGAVYREPLDASTSVMLSQSTRVLGPLAMDGANLYVGSRGLGEVLECPLGSASCTGISESLSPTALFADGTALWVTESSPSAGYVYRCTSSAPCLFTTPAFATTTGPLGGIVSDGTRVYWAHQGGTEVMSCPVSGCVGAPSVVGGVAPGPTSVAVDATAVYWVDSLGVRKIAK